MGSEEKETVDFGQLCRLVDKLPKGKARSDAYVEAIRLADKLQSTDRQLELRCGYAGEMYFQDDPPKCIGVAAEFGSLF